MNDDDGSGTPKLEAAKDALNRVVDGLPDDAQVGLRLYGSKLANVSKQEGCQDTELASPVAPLDRAKLKQAISGITAKGRTPIGLALEKAGEDLPKDGRRTVILVSDGGSNCSPPSPCQAAKTLAGGGVDLRIEAIGFQVADQARRQLECIAAAGNGAYRDAQDAGELADSLQSLSVRALRRFDASGIPIAGGPDAARATAVPKPGQYLDSIAPNETRFFKVPVGLGQKLDVSATVIARIPGARGTFARFEVEITNPDGDLVDSDSNNGVGGESVSSVASTDQITEPETADFGDKPGDYLVDAHARRPGRHPLRPPLPGRDARPPQGHEGQSRPSGGDRGEARRRGSRGQGRRRPGRAHRLGRRDHPRGRGRRVRDRRRDGAAPQGGDVIRALVIAIAALLAGATAAGAQTQATTTAGGSFNSAPVLESGTTYRDSVRLGEELFYGVKLAVGQKARWQIRVLGAAPEDLDNFGQISLSLATPLREDLVFDDDNSDFNGRTAASVQAETDTVVGEGVENADSDVAVPGTYYAVLRFTNLFREESSSRLRVYEFPLDVTVTVTGEPQPDVPLPAVDAELNAPQPTTEEKPAEEDEGAALLTGASTGTEGGDDAVREALQLVLAGLLVGSVLGLLAVAFRRVTQRRS